MITHGLARSAPKALPARATPTPRAEYMTPMPRTYMEASRKARTRETASSLAPKMPTTMGIMGYTQGVRDVRNPATKTRDAPPPAGGGGGPRAPRRAGGGGGGGGGGPGPRRGRSASMPREVS